LQVLCVRSASIRGSAKCASRQASRGVSGRRKSNSRWRRFLSFATFFQRRSGSEITRFLSHLPPQPSCRPSDGRARLRPIGVLGSMPLGYVLGYNVRVDLTHRSDVFDPKSRLQKTLWLFAEHHHGNTTSVRSAVQSN
jgi:hypothetical protein